MTSKPLVFLVGCPASGKSTLAKRLIQQHQHYKRVSTDHIRERLYGDATIQGNWQDIEKTVLQQVEQCLTQGQGVIYDATNAYPPWRMELVKKLKQRGATQITASYLDTPLAVCLQRNCHRQRQVPETIIQDFHQALVQCPPTLAEGFTAVYPIPWNPDEQDRALNRMTGDGLTN